MTPAVSPYNIPLYMLNPDPIEYRLPVQCLSIEADFKDFEIFNCLTMSAISSDNSAVKNRISEISLLEENWDGYGATVPSVKVIKNAYKFIDALIKENFDLKPDAITPTPYGSIVLDIESKLGLVSIEIGSEKVGYFTEYIEVIDVASDGINTDFRSVPDEIIYALEKLYVNRKQSVA